MSGEAGEKKGEEKAYALKEHSTLHLRWYSIVNYHWTTILKHFLVLRKELCAVSCLIKRQTMS